MRESVCQCSPHRQRTSNAEDPVSPTSVPSSPHSVPQSPHIGPAILPPRSPSAPASVPVPSRFTFERASSTASQQPLKGMVMEDLKRTSNTNAPSALVLCGGRNHDRTAGPPRTEHPREPHGFPAGSASYQASLMFPTGRSVSTRALVLAHPARPAEGTEPRNERHESRCTPGGRRNRESQGTRCRRRTGPAPFPLRGYLRFPQRTAWSRRFPGIGASAALAQLVLRTQ